MGSRREGKERLKVALWGCAVVALVMMWGCGTQTPPDTRAADEKTIRDLDAQWAKTAATKDVDGTVSYYADDASLLAPNVAIASDKASIRASWAGLLGPDASLTWQADKVEVARSSDLAYIVGAYQLTMKDSQGKPALDRGKFVEVWKKQADGKWKVAADIFNSDLAAQAPAPAPVKKASPRHHAKRKGRGNRRRVQN
jgi:ketosteroid isomerase-like protein